MGEEQARDVGPDGIEIAYERFGDPSGPPVLLLMGGGAQMINWPEGFCAELTGRGLYVIRYDNRDTGRSTHFTGAPAPDLRKAMSGDHSTASYTLSDMAADAVGLLDALGIDGAHFVGASMGGMIAQTAAIEHPARVRSLTSMMSTTGDPAVGRTDPTAVGHLGGPPPDRQGYIDWTVRSLRATASPGFAFEEQAVAERAALAYDRGFDFQGMLRQAVAVLASGDRTERLHDLRVPTLVLHGDSDVMCDVSGGRATADAIPNAELVVIEGWGHNIPRELWPRLADEIEALIQRAESPAQT